MQLTGDIYIHDFHGIAAGMPYSYYGKTSIPVKIDGNISYVTMEELHSILSARFGYEVNDDSEIVYPQNIQVLDDYNKWVNVTRILKHESHTNLIQLETKNGYCTVVTADHPVITDNGDITASNLTLNNNMKISNSYLPLTEEKNCI